MRRAEHKRAVLSSWVSMGVPADKLKTIPRSLNEARMWEDAELGVEKIGSKSDFTKSHPEHGPVVVDIERLLVTLRGRSKPRPRHLHTRKMIPNTAEVKAIKASLEAVVSQWHMLRQELLFAKQVTAESQVAIQDLKAALLAKDNEITSLRKQLKVRRTRGPQHEIR